MKRISKTEIKEMRSQSKKNRIMFAFTLPTVILYTIFFLVTMLIGVYYSFTDWNGISKDYTFVGLENYVKVLTDERFREAIWFNIGYTIALVVLLIVIPLMIALALNRIKRLSTLFRSIYFIPAVISMVTVGLIWNPEDRSARNVELEYFLGDSLLVVPVFDQEDEIDVYLPNGQWIDLFTHERIKGGRWVKRKIELDKIPVFIRQNKMIPMLTKIPENIEEKYENLDVILFCEDEIRDTYIDDGNVQNLKAKIEEGTLFINTDMDASYFTVYAEKCLDNAVVNGQNWEIKKEKEGYYKIALEK